jgi:plasmid stabilization system protein ParE
MQRSIKDARQTTVKRFPYLVVYRILDKEIIVVAIVHTSRDPAVWQSRI